MSYTPEVGASPTGDYVSKRESVLHVMAAASFLVFFQAYLVAPLIPSLSIEFHASTNFLGMLVPAYMLPYGISTLFMDPSPTGSAGRQCFLPCWD
jgi:predicted MFS family arabinose efflux permease